jgi:hypothetical protein
MVAPLSVELAGVGGSLVCGFGVGAADTRARSSLSALLRRSGKCRRIQTCLRGSQKQNKRRGTDGPIPNIRGFPPEAIAASSLTDIVPERGGAPPSSKPCSNHRRDRRPFLPKFNIGAANMWLGYNTTKGNRDCLCSSKRQTPA